MEQAATEEAVEFAALDGVLARRMSNSRGKKDRASGSYRSLSCKVGQPEGVRLAAT